MILKVPHPTLFAGAILLGAATTQTVDAQGLLSESGTSILAPTFAPTGGLALAPQEYVMVAWSVNENASGVYTYSYTVQNPVGDVLLTATGGLTTTPEDFDAFSVDFDTSFPGAYLAGSQTGGAFQQVNTIDLAWFFNPVVSAGNSAPTVTFQSDLAPGLGNANAEDAVPPSPWSSVSFDGQEVPVPTVVPEPTVMTLFAAAVLLISPFRRHFGQIRTATQDARLRV